LGDEGFSCSLDVLYEGLEISKLQFLIKEKYLKNLLAVFFLQFLVIKTLDPDPDSLEMLDPDPYQDSMSPDPQLCFEQVR
jgi:hypothetical protein